jgi:hypothetical protein
VAQSTKGAAAQTVQEAPEQPVAPEVAEESQKWPITAREAARLLRDDPRFTGGKLTDKAIRRLVREHDIAGMDDDKYTRHSYDAATFELIAETYFAPKDRREAQTEPEADAPDA